MAVVSPGASSARSSIPTVPGALPLLGHSLALLRDPLTLLLALPEHGDLVRLRIRAGCAAALVFGPAFPPDALERTVSDITLYVKGIFTRMFLPPALARLPLPANRRYEQVRKRLRQAVSEAVDGYRHTGKPAGGDLLTALMESDPSAAGPASHTGLVDQLILMLMAGTESTATTVAWALHELARDPALQRRVRREIDAVVEVDDPVHAHVEHLELTGRMLTETLRKYPAADSQPHHHHGGHPRRSPHPRGRHHRLQPLPAPPRPRRLPRPGPLRPGPLAAAERAPVDAKSVGPLRWRNPQMRGRRLRHERGDPGPRRDPDPLDSCPGARQRGPARRLRSPATGGPVSAGGCG